MENEQKTYWVLSIDGGGVRGLFSSILLTKIEKLLKTDLCEMFDLVVGASIGGLIALDIGQGCKKGEGINLVPLFSQKNLNKICNKSLFEKIFPCWFRTKYDGKGKRSVIDENIIIKKFGDVVTKTAIITYSLKNEKFKIFRSWDKNDKNINPADLADATSAAPTYFPCVKIGNEWHMDGGVAANNPSLVALQEAQELWGKDADIRIVSIGTGHTTISGIKGSDADNWGAPKWLYNGLVDIMLDAPLDLMCSYCEKILPDNCFLRLDGIVEGEYIDNISKEYRKSLENSAEKTYYKNEGKIISFFYNNKNRKSPSVEKRKLNITT